jgi:hypothetical protein
MSDKCETGCISFTGGEKRHHKDCVFYKDSFTEMYDNLESKLKAQQELIDTIRQSIEEMCIDDCGINLSVCDRGTLEEIIRITDKRARLLLAKLEAR